MKLIQNRPTQLQPVYRSLAKMESLSKRAIDILEPSTKGTFDLIWNNPDVTPAEMLAGMGNTAAQGFMAHYTSVMALRAAGKDTSEYDTPPVPYTIHTSGDLAGHVTLD